MINPLTNPRVEKIAPTPSTAPANATAVQPSGGVPQLKKPAGMIPGAPAPITPAATASNTLPTAVVRPPTSQASPQVGGVPSVPNPVSGLAATLSAPTRLQPGQAAPDVNPQAPGTQFGNTLRDTRRGIVNDQVATLNTMNRAGAGIANTATYLPRAALGFTRDTTRAALGMDPSPNAGQPIGGITAPQLAKPYIQPPVNFALTHSDVPVRDPRVAAPAAATAAAPSGATGAGGASPAATNPNFDPGADNISTSNLATAMKPSFTAPKVGAAAVTQPGIDSGTIVEGGRKLNYGAMVNGVPTFSDGSSGIKGVAGNIPRTMSDDSIASLGARAQVIPAQVSTLASDSMGGATPTQGQMVDQHVAQIQRPITGSRPSAEQFAAADRNAIALRDPRSAAGTAARSLEMEAQYGRGGARRVAAQSLQDLTTGTNEASLASQQAAGKLALQQQAGMDAMAQTEQQGKNAVAETEAEAQALMQRPRAGQQVTLADGTLGLQDSITGAITASKLADGTTAKAQMTRDDSATKRANEIMDQISKNAAELAKSAMASPPPDAPPNWKPNPSDFREQAAGFAGLEVRADKSGKKYVNINGQVVPL